MEVNYIKLGLTLFLALTLSSLTVDGVRAYFANQVLLEASKKLEVVNRINKEESIQRALEHKRLQQKQSEIRDKKSVKQRNDREKLKAIRKTNNETCSFWRKQYSEVKSEYREQMKIAACNRAKND